ncbi:MAG: peptide ABC transporter substrate-binding protein [Nitrospinota bacterium]
MPRPQIFSKLIPAFALLVILSGCSKGPTSADSSTFRMTIKNEPPALDASLATDSVSFTILTNLMEGLTQYDADLNPIPAIAKRWEYSNEGTTITFYLREDAVWSDGKKVTAEDFEYSWKRLLAPETAAQYAYFLFDIKNAFEYNMGKLKDPDQVGVKAIREDVLEVTLKKPVVYFPSITTFMVTFPLRKDVIEKYGDDWTEPENIVTNGPYLLKEWEHEYKLVLKANSKHYEGKPEINEVQIFVVQEPTTALTLYETGELDYIELPPIAIPHYKKSPEYRNKPQLRGYYYGFNVKKPPMDNVLVRRALAHAINRSLIPKILKGGELPSSSWVPKGMFGYNEGIGSKFDPEKARALLAEAGYPGGKDFPKVTAVFNTESKNRLIGAFIQEQWKKHLNIDVEFENQEWKVFLSQLDLDPPQIFRLGWGADFPDPDNFMNLFISTSGNNRLKWANANYDQLIAKGSTLKNPKDRQKVYDEAQVLLTETDVPMVPLFVTAQNLLVKPHVRGLKTNAMELLYLKRIRIEKGF